MQPESPPLGEALWPGHISRAFPALRHLLGHFLQSLGPLCHPELPLTLFAMAANSDPGAGGGQVWKEALRVRLLLTRVKAGICWSPAMTV